MKNPHRFSAHSSQHHEKDHHPLGQGDNRPSFRFTWEGEDAVDVLLLASRSLENHDLPMAFEFIEAAIKLDPEYFWSYAAAGSLALRNKRFPEAISWLQKCLELDPTAGKTYDNLSVAYYETGDLDSAHGFIDKALERQPKNSKLCLRKIRWLAESSRWKELHHFYQENHSTIHEAGEAHLWVCLALAQLGEIEKARTLFEQATLRSKRQYPHLARQIAPLIELDYYKW